MRVSSRAQIFREPLLEIGDLRLPAELVGGGHALEFGKHASEFVAISNGNSEVYRAWAAVIQQSDVNRQTANTEISAKLIPPRNVRSIQCAVTRLSKTELPLHASGREKFPQRPTTRSP
jgi:hypothetical protein